MGSRVLAALAVLGFAIGCGSSSNPPPAAQPLAFITSVPLSDEASAPTAIDPPPELVLTFSQPLDGATVPGSIDLVADRPGGAWAVDPPVDLAWDAARPAEVAVRPQDGALFPRGHAYRLTVKTTLRSATGQALPEPRVGYFATDHSSFLGVGGSVGSASGRSVIYVVSDIHMADERAVDDTGPYPPYAWFRKNRDPLAQFLDLASRTADLKELVIAGDLFDEWVAPMDVTAYGPGRSEADFFASIGRANPGVIGALDGLSRQEGVRVTYVPGNHDMLVQETDVRGLLPLVNQVRDGQRPGKYSPPGHDEIVVEHGHRYDFFNAPDPFSNLDITRTDSILPPGFFVSKVAATADRENGRPPGASGPLAAQGMDASNLLDEEYFCYGVAWVAVLAARPLKPLDLSRTVATGADGYTLSYPLRDLVPQGVGEHLDVTLYKHIETSWPAREIANGVAKPIPFQIAIANSAVNLGIDLQATWQYFLNAGSRKRIVVFGHTHDVTVAATRNHAGQGAIYANSGTWIDNHAPESTMTYIAIVPPHGDSTVTTVTSWRYVPGGAPVRLASAAITIP